MEVPTQHEQASPAVRKRVQDSFDRQGLMSLFDEESEVLTVEYKINLLAPAAGDHLKAIGTVLRPGRTLTVCQLEVYGVRPDGTRELVANGQQTLIRVNRPAS